MDRWVTMSARISIYLEEPALDVLERILIVQLNILVFAPLTKDLINGILILSERQNKQQYVISRIRPEITNLERGYEQQNSRRYNERNYELITELFTKKCIFRNLVRKTTNSSSSLNNRQVRNKESRTVQRNVSHSCRDFLCTLVNFFSWRENKISKNTTRILFVCTVKIIMILDHDDI